MTRYILSTFSLELDHPNHSIPRAIEHKTSIYSSIFNSIIYKSKGDFVLDMKKAYLIIYIFILNFVTISILLFDIK